VLLARLLSRHAIDGERSVRLVQRDTLADIKPSFEDDADFVPPPPREPTFSNSEKVVERDVEVYRKKASPSARIRAFVRLTS
jgi:hypothetical protein